MPAENTLSRKSRCPCGSGARYKHCHGRFDWMGIANYLSVPIAVLEKFEQTQAREQSFRTTHKIQPAKTVEHNGRRLVAVGDELFERDADEAGMFTDFLLDYPSLMVGEDWLHSEMKKPENQAHPLATWKIKTLKQLSQATHIGGGRIATIPSNAAMSWMQLAYDLYLIRNNADLQRGILNRLKRSDNNFQGARFELAVVAIMICAGFSVAYSAEDDPSKTHPEFIAFNEAGLALAVEAKSRSRDGVLGYTQKGWKGRGSNWRHSISGDALAKAGVKSYMAPAVVFIEPNVPVSTFDSLAEVEKLVRQEVASYEASHEAEVSFGAAFYINDPSYHDLDAQPRGLTLRAWCIPVAITNTATKPDPRIYKLISEGFARRCSIPQTYPTA